MNLYKIKKSFLHMTRAFLVIMLLTFTLFPIIWMISTAFKPRIDMFRLPPRWIFRPTIDNFKYVFTYMPVTRWMLNSGIISLGTTLISLLLGVPAGYALSRFHFRGKTLLFVLILFTRVVPPIVILLPFRIIIQWLGLYGTHFAVIFIDTIFDAAFIAWLMAGVFENLPIDLEEAALLDGCSPIQVFLRVSLPLSRPGLATAALFTFILSWNDFLFALSLTSPETSTLPVGMLSTYGILQQGWTYMMAMGCLAVVPVAFISLLLQRYYVSGLTFGGIK